MMNADGNGGNPSLLTSTTAPGKAFATRSDLAAHYKSDWHRYNLKRREAGLPMLREVDFQARLEAALALRKEREQREERSGTGHLKKGKKDKARKSRKSATATATATAKDERNGKDINTSATTNNTERQSKRERREAKHAARALIAEDDAADQNDGHAALDDAMDMDADDNADISSKGEDPEPIIDPCQSLFDNHCSPTPEANLQYMTQKYGFFLPDAEYLIDLEGYLGYCQEKIKLGHYCLYCQKVYKTWSGCQKHMIDARHAKVRYERGIDQEEFDVFYDFAEANEEFLGSGGAERKTKAKESTSLAAEDAEDVVYEEDMDDDDGEWEDVSDDEDMAEDDADVDMDDDEYQEYETELRTHGFDITPLGELIFPDGRIIGHRGLSRYYKQRFAPDGERAAVTAARRAAGERVYAGRVYSTQQGRQLADGASESQETTLALAKAGLVAGAAAGRSGRGILVSASGSSGANGGAGGFTALSLYRYKAAVKKSRREEARGRRLQQRSKMNINRMDKKANRLMNGVSVAHAAR